MTQKEIDLIFSLIDKNTSKREYPVGHEVHIPEWGIDKLKQEIKNIFQNGENDEQ